MIEIDGTESTICTVSIINQKVKYTIIDNVIKE